jgi:hypothetical protein
MPIARTATIADLQPLLELFRVSEVSSAVEPIERAQDVWRQTLEHDGVRDFVSETDGKIVATCMLITAPNLLRSGRGHAFLENVVTHPAFSRKGSRSCRCSGRSFRGLGDKLLSCLASKRQTGPTGAPLLRALRLRTRPTCSLRRTPSPPRIDCCDRLKWGSMVGGAGDPPPASRTRAPAHETRTRARAPSQRRAKPSAISVSMRFPSAPRWNVIASV